MAYLEANKLNLAKASALARAAREEAEDEGGKKRISEEQDPIELEGKGMNCHLERQGLANS